MSKRRPSLLFVALLLAAASPLSAEYIFLTNGDIIVAKVEDIGKSHHRLLVNQKEQLIANGDVLRVLYDAKIRLAEITTKQQTTSKYIIHEESKFYIVRQELFAAEEQKLNRDLIIGLKIKRAFTNRDLQNLRLVEQSRLESIRKAKEQARLAKEKRARERADLAQALRQDYLLRITTFYTLSSNNLTEFLDPGFGGKVAIGKNFFKPWLYPLAQIGGYRLKGKENKNTTNFFFVHLGLTYPVYQYTNFVFSAFTVGGLHSGWVQKASDRPFAAASIEGGFYIDWYLASVLAITAEASAIYIFDVDIPTIGGNFYLGVVVRL